MLDEAHERTLYTDIAIGLLKKVMPLDTATETNSNFINLYFIHHKKKYTVFIPTSVSTVSFTDSEEAARPEADCGLCHSGCQGD